MAHVVTLPGPPVAYAAAFAVASNSSALSPVWQAACCMHAAYCKPTPPPPGYSCDTTLHTPAVHWPACAHHYALPAMQPVFHAAMTDTCSRNCPPSPAWPGGPGEGAGPAPGSVQHGHDGPGVLGVLAGLGRHHGLHHLAPHLHLRWVAASQAMPGTTCGSCSAGICLTMQVHGHELSGTVSCDGARPAGPSLAPMTPSSCHLANLCVHSHSSLRHPG